MIDYDKYYQKGGNYLIPTEIFNELQDKIESLENINSSLELELEEKITEIETQKGYEEELTEMENKIKDFMFKLKLDKCYTKELEEFINNYGRGLFY